MLWEQEVPGSNPGAPTAWNDGYVGTVGRQNLSGLIETVRELVEEFANDYLAANPRNR